MPQEEQDSARTRIDRLIVDLGDWRGERLARIRQAIHTALPEVTETWKWMGSPVWEQDGIVVVGNAHKAKVKLTFPQGARLADPDRLFNAGLSGKTWRAIDLHEQDVLDMSAFQALVQGAAALNAGRESSGGGSPGPR